MPASAATPPWTGSGYLAPAAPDSANRADSPTSEVQSFAGHYSENADPYAISMIGDSADPEPLRRGGSYYAMLGVGALALFAISMFVTILLLR